MQADSVHTIFQVGLAFCERLKQKGVGEGGIKADS